MRVLALIAAVLAPCSAAPAAHLVEHLPGLDGPLPSALYSGFLVRGCAGYSPPVGQQIRVNGLLYRQVTGEHHVHYMLAESEGDPSTDPLVLWLNGGPGSSSLIGFFQELGPVIVSSNSSVVRNPYAWSTAASILYLESPTGAASTMTPTPDPPGFIFPPRLTSHEPDPEECQWLSICPRCLCQALATRTARHPGPAASAATVTNPLLSSTLHPSSASWSSSRSIMAVTS